MPEEEEIDINSARPFSISRDQFGAMLYSIKVPQGLNYDFLFETFCMIAEGIKGIQQENPTIARMAINPFELALYLVNQHSFYLATHPDIAKDGAFLERDGYQNYLASVSLDKFYTNERLAYQMGSLTSRFSPTMSTLDLYLNFILGMLSRYKRNEPTNTLIVDIMNKGFQIAKCVSSLLEGGYETEAFSTWRTLHENECILSIIVKYGQPVIESYLRHMKYGAAFRGGLPSKEEIDETFVEIKENMRAAGLKSKDMKRYIEYGWLLAVPNVDQIPEVKLNFRDGVQRVAGLSAYSKVYEMSSEVAHSSPLLIYSRKNYFFSLTLLSLFESFFRLEKIFTTLYMSTVSEEERQRYIRMRTLYLGDLQTCYEIERKRFAALGKKKKAE
ncbi:MAG: DUF5677 domain-containing protein [Bacilli bacterium]|nr:DUF5677 domain-containing protein [Bacilli bacterium]